MHVFAEVLVNDEAARWLDQVAAMGFPLRYVEHDGTLRPLRRDRLRDRTIWMAYFHRD
jgi:hypothetical protein